jgi:hypothetical protein
VTSLVRPVISIRIGLVSGSVAAGWEPCSPAPCESAVVVGAPERGAEVGAAALVVGAALLLGVLDRLVRRDDGLLRRELDDGLAGGRGDLDGAQVGGDAGQLVGDGLAVVDDGQGDERLAALGVVIGGAFARVHDVHVAQRDAADVGVVAVHGGDLLRGLRDLARAAAGQRDRRSGGECGNRHHATSRPLRGGHSFQGSHGLSLHVDRALLRAGA